MQEQLKHNPEFSMYGSVGVKKYPEFAVEQINELMQDPNAAQDREEMWHNFDDLKARLQALPLGAPLIPALEATILQMSPFARTEFGVPQTEEEQPKPRVGLAQHLEQAGMFARTLLLNSGESRFPGILSAQQAQLLAEVITPIHDILKYLGTVEAQISTDHQVMIATLVQECFVDKTVILNGVPVSITSDMAELIANVVGNHENLFVEEGRREFIESKEPAERMKAVFFVVDTLTDTLKQDEKGSWQFVPASIWQRLGNLYFRHIDPVEGKVYRPEWGEISFADLKVILDKLEGQGLTIERGQNGQTYLEALRSSMVAAIKLSLDLGRLHDEFNTIVTHVEQSAEQKKQLLITLKARWQVYAGDAKKFGALLEAAITDPDTAKPITVYTPEQLAELEKLRDSFPAAS